MNNHITIIFKHGFHSLVLFIFCEMRIFAMMLYDRISDMIRKYDTATFLNNQMKQIFVSLR